MRRLLPLAALAFLLAPLVPARADEALDRLERAFASPSATGLLVTQVEAGSQAADLGVLTGDVIVAYAGTPTLTLDALREAIGAAMERESVEMVVVRAGGERRTFSLTPGRIGVGLAPVTKGEAAGPLPPATDVTLDFAAFAGEGRDEWHALSIGGEKRGFEHAQVKIEDGRIVLRSEVAFDGGEQWGLNHFDVTVVATAAAPPQLVSVRFENPLHGYVGEGKVETRDDGAREWTFSWRTAGGELGERKAAVPEDLPVVPSYLLSALACAMPRTKGACLHFRTMDEVQGEIGLPGALLAAEEELVPVGEGTVKAWRFEVYRLGGPRTNAFWVGPDGHVLQADYGGAVTRKATKAEALEGLHHGIRPRTAAE